MTGGTTIKCLSSAIVGDFAQYCILYAQLRLQLVVAALGIQSPVGWTEDDCRWVSTTERTESDCWAVAISAVLMGGSRATRDTGCLDKESASAFSMPGRTLIVNS